MFSLNFRLVLRPAYTLFFLPFCAAFAATESPKILDAGEQQWKRTPEQVVPYVSAAPSIDGTVDAREWSAAADLGPFKVEPDGTPDGLQRKLWVCYDDRNVYVAFKLQRPAGAISPRVPAKVERMEGGAGGVVSDAIEVLFSPKLDFKKSYSFWVYGNGAYGDALCNPGKTRSWDAQWQRAARVTDQGWEGEIAIPFAAFGLSAAPAPGEWWGFDFVDNRQTPSRLLAHWSFRGGSWHAFQNFGRIRFAKEPAVRFVQAGELGKGQSGVAFEALAGANSEPLNVQIELLKRKPGEEGGPKSYFDNIDSGVSHDAQAEFSKGVTLDDMIKFAGTFYDPVAEVSKVEKSLELRANEPVRFGAGGVLPYGEYLARYYIQNAAGDIVAAGCSVFRNEAPLNFRVEPYWLYSQVVDVFVDLKKTPFTGEANLALNVLPAEGAGQPLKSVQKKVAGTESVAKVAVDVTGIKPGSYRLEAVLRDSAGKELARNVQPVKRPEFPAWYKNNIGNEIAVPQPWTPVKVGKGGEVSVWGRTYDLSGIFPKAVTSQGKEVLAAPVQLIVQTASGAVKWKVEKLECKKQNAAAAVYNVSMSGNGLRVSGTMRIEFDGLVWYDLSLSPTGEPVNVGSLKLEIPVESSLCELMSRHNFLSDPALTSALPKADLHGAPGIIQDSRIPFTPYLWIGNETGGMGFVAEAPIDWNISAPGSVLEVQAPQAKQPGRILANIFQQPQVVQKPIRLQFGLQATPIREVAKDRSILNIFQKVGVFGDEKTFADLAAKGCKVVVFYYNWRGNSKTEMGGTPERPVAAEQQDKLKEAVKLAHKHGLKVIMFTGWGVNATSPNWKNYSYELGKYPITNGGWGTFNAAAGANGAYVDFMAWGHADLAREYEVDGVLWDSAANLSVDENLRIGNAWVDAQGRVRPKFDVLATRDLYRRIYNIYKGEVRKDGVIYNHCGSLWPINVFADMQNRGEGRPMTAKTLRDSWLPFEEFRSEYSAEPFGTLYSGEINDWEKLPMRVSTHLAVTLLHGTYAKEIGIGKNFRSYDYEARPLPAMWDAFGWLPMNGTETRHYYYQNLKGKYQAVKATPASLLSSAFVSGDKKRAVVVVSNLDITPVNGAEIQFDLASLGMPANRSLKVQDGVTLELIPVNNQRVSVDIQRERYRVLRLTVE